MWGELLSTSEAGGGSWTDHISCDSRLTATLQMTPRLAVSRVGMSYVRPTCRVVRWSRGSPHPTNTACSIIFLLPALLKTVHPSLSLTSRFNISQASLAVFMEHE